MKILCSTYEYPPIGGGGAQVAHPLAAYLLSHGHEIDVVTSGMSDLQTCNTMDGVEVHRVRCIRRFRHYATTPELFTYIWPAYRRSLELHKARAFDINHTHFAMPSGVASYLLFRKTGLPYVTTIHGSDVPGYNPDRFRVSHWLAHPLWRRIILNSVKVISASEFLKRLIQKHIDVPVDIIQNGYSPDSTIGEMPEKKNRILVVTRIFQRKGLQHFIDALVDFKHDWEIVIAGDGPYLPTLKAQALRLGLNISFTGFIQGRELLDLYATSKVFVFPSLQENFPVVLLEAMQAGCAIITTNVDGCAEVIGDAGIVVEPKRPDQIRNALKDLLRNENEIQRLSLAAKRRIELFRWPRIANQYDALLREALAQHRLSHATLAPSGPRRGNPKN